MPMCKNRGLLVSYGPLAKAAPEPRTKRRCVSHLITRNSLERRWHAIQRWHAAEPVTQAISGAQIKNQPKPKNKTQRYVSH